MRVSLSDPVEPHVDSSTEPLPHSSGRHLPCAAAMVKEYVLPHATLGGESTGSALGLSVESTGEAEGGAEGQLQKQCQRLVPQLLVVLLVLRREMLRISE